MKRASEQSSNGRNLIFSFEPFDGVNPDYFFAFDDDNDLTYGKYSDGLESFEKLWVRKDDKRKNDLKVRFGGYSNNLLENQQPISYTYEAGPEPEDCDVASQSAYFFTNDCNRGTTGGDNIIGLYNAGAPYPYRKDSSVLANTDLSQGYSSTSGQYLQHVTDDAPDGYDWATTFDYCIRYQRTDLAWYQPENGWMNWLGFDTYPQLLNGKEITVSFNFKFISNNGIVFTPSNTNYQGDAVGLKIAGQVYNDWFGANDECANGNWCRFEETLTLTETDDEQKILFFWNAVSNGDPAEWGCFFRFNDFKVEWSA